VIKLTKTLTVGLIAGLGLAHMAQAQDLVHKAPPQDKPIAIINATIHTVSGGVIEDGTVLFTDGVIRAVGAAHLRGGSHERIIHAKGKHVYPGMIAASTVIGLAEVASVRATLDYAETGDVSPEVRAAVSVNPDSWLIPVTRANGVLTVGVMPQGGTIPGRASVMRMDGWTWEDMALRDDAGLVINWPRMRNITAWWMTKSEGDQDKERAEALAKLDDTFDRAAAYFAAKAADDSTPTDVRYEAMRGVMQRGAPVFVRAQELEQIQSAASWSAKRKLRCVIVGGRDAHLAADLLKKHDISVIVGGTLRTPRRSDSNYDEAYALPAKLDAAGVRWCLAGGGNAFSAANERNLPDHAGMAVAFGLDPAAALRSITLSAAEILGVDDTLGSIEVGKAATLFIADGDILEITTSVEAAFIDGRQIDLSNKQTALDAKYRDKYRQLGILEEK